LTDFITSLVASPLVGPFFPLVALPFPFLIL